MGNLRSGLELIRCLVTFSSLAGSCLAQLQPTIAVFNAAGFSAIVPYRAVAPGSLVIINAPVPIDPDPSRYTVRLRPQGGGELRAQVLSTMTGQLGILALLPAELPLGLMEVVLETPTETRPPATVRVVRSAFGFYSVSGSGLGAAVAHVFRQDSTQVVNRLTEPARPGDYLILWGTGLGSTRATDVVIEIGGIAVTPAYAGPAPGNPGLDQVNVLLPPEAPLGCYTSVLLRTGDAVSNEVTVATAAQPGTCVHPFELAESELLALDNGQRAPLARATLRSEIVPTLSALHTLYTRREEAAVEFRRLRHPEEITLLAQPLVADSCYFSCRLQNPPRLTIFGELGPGDPGRVTVTGRVTTLALEPITTSSPNFRNALPEPPTVPDPANVPPPVFLPDVWRFAGTGGQTFGPFEAVLNLPPTVRWTNRASFTTINRMQDQVVTWAADGYSATDVMTVSVSSVSYLNSSTEQPDASDVVCVAPATAGQLTIPSNLLRRIPAAPLVNGVPLGIIQLLLTPRASQRMRFQLPLATGGSQNGIVDYLLAETLRIEIQ